MSDGGEGVTMAKKPQCLLRSHGTAVSVTSPEPTLPTGKGLRGPPGTPPFPRSALSPRAARTAFPFRPRPDPARGTPGSGRGRAGPGRGRAAPEASAPGRGVGRASSRPPLTFSCSFRTSTACCCCASSAPCSRRRRQAWPRAASLAAMPRARPRPARRAPQRGDRPAVGRREHRAGAAAAAAAAGRSVELAVVPRLLRLPGELYTSGS